MSVLARTVNPKLVFTWHYQNRSYDVRADGSYMVSGVSPCHLLNAGSQLSWGGMIFDRSAGDAANVSGHWLSSAQDEDVLLRDDGTYVWHTIGELPDAIGEWSLSGSDTMTWELRATVTTNQNQITFDAVFGNSETGTYALSDMDKTLTISFSGLSITYTRP